MVEFGPDGFLYIGMGDGGSANDPDNRAQNINELLGKMLRIDVDRANGAVPYSSPSDNPFIGATPGRDEIYAVGLRNPFRFSFDRVTGLLYAGDVGQGAREEVDIITRGDNYGWRVFEGTLCTNNDPTLCNPVNFIPPIAEYDHSLGRCSIIGGHVYRGTAGALPAGKRSYKKSSPYSKTSCGISCPRKFSRLARTATSARTPNTTPPRNASGFVNRAAGPAQEAPGGILDGRPDQDSARPRRLGLEGGGAGPAKERRSSPISWSPARKPTCRTGRISTSSPIGRGLLGKKVGDVVKIQISGGVKETGDPEADHHPRRGDSETPARRGRV